MKLSEIHPDTYPEKHHPSDVKFTHSNGIYSVSVAGETEFSSTNPMQAWRRYISRLDGIGSRRIGDMFEKQGKNRWTGEDDPEQMEF